ncbi:hypothetical protein [Treponema pectinovorum]|uniref:hypothetical protein n=1 Tax=Treponema pectinovorum TaxID=164 RepID=UPI0011CA103A|nr:hypothetical protein [Treponema pectinovorum]
MGLFSHIENQKRSTGLLARVAELESKNQDENLKIDFYSLSDLLSIKKYAIFSRISDFFVMSDSCGFDLETISYSLSTKDFWNGFNFEDEVCKIFFDEKKNPFLQLFSPKERLNIDSICIFPFDFSGERAYFLVADEDCSNKDFAILKSLVPVSLLESNFENDYFEKGINLCPAQLFIGTSKLSLQNEFNDKDEKISKIMKFTAFKQIYFYLKKLFPSPNACFFDESGEFKIAIFSKEEIKIKILEILINDYLKSFFNKTSLSNMILIKAGTCNDKKGLTDFLTQGKF